MPGLLGGAGTGRIPSPADPSTPKRHSGNGRAPVRGDRPPAPPARPVLPPQDSARLRDAMLADIAALSPQAAAAWAGQMLASKNRLTAEDARAVEQAFEAQFAALDQDLVEVLPLAASGIVSSLQCRCFAAAPCGGEWHGGCVGAETRTGPLVAGKPAGSGHRAEMGNKLRGGSSGHGLDLFAK